MNKRFKIVSSLALAGMLVTGSLGMNKVLASTDNYTTNPVAVYRNLVEGKTVVPFVLVNRQDVLTVKDVTESDMFQGKVETINGTAISSLDMVVGTGDKFTTTDGTEYTIIVYGDTNGDGTVNSLDALEVEKNSVGTTVFDDVQKEAADVKNDARVNSLDSYEIKRFSAGLTDSVIDTLPAEEEPVMDSNYAMTLNDGKYINNVNVTNSTLAIQLKETLSEATTLKLVVTDKENNKVEEDIVISAHTDYVETTTPIDLSTLENGTIKGELYDDEELVATFEVEKNVVTPAATSVRTNRVNTRTATLSLEKMGESDVTKVRYVVKGISESVTNKADLTNELTVENGKLTDATIAENLANNTAYKVFYVVENQYGSQSDIKSAVIAKDTADVTAETAVETLNAPDLTATATPEFTWTAVSDKTYVVTLYKDGVALLEEEVTASSTSGTTTTFAGAMKENGTYKASIVVKGDANGALKTDSEVTESEEVTVTTLKSVENVVLENTEDGKVVLSWTNPNAKEDFKGYEIKLYKINEDGEETDETSVPCEKLDDNEEVINQVEINDVDSNTIYVAKVKVLANDNQSAVLSTDVVTSNEFYKVEAPNMDTATRGTTSVTFEITPIEIANKDVTYKVEVYDVKVDNDNTEARYTLKSTKDVTVNEDNEITIDGLTSLNTYAFKLIATVDGNEVESEYSDEIRTLPVIEALTVDTKEEAEKADSGKIAVDGDNLVINGESFNTTAGANNMPELADAKAIVEKLVAGDVVTINDDATEVSIQLNGAASYTDVEERDFDTVLSDAVVEIESNKYTKIVKGTFKGLTLKGEGSILDVTEVTMAGAEEERLPIIVTNGVEVIADDANGYELKLEAGSTSIINDIKVTAEKEVTMSVDETTKKLSIPANESENNLVFENSSSEAATIEFTGLDNNTSEQKGTITIKSNGGKVTVDSTDVNVSASINVEVNNGEVDITEPSLTGDKTVTVSATEETGSKVIAKTLTPAPEAVIAECNDSGSVELKAYTDEEIKTTFGVEAQEDVIAISEYIDSFGLNGTGATIDVETGAADTVTITIPKGAEGLEIGNIK